MNRRILILALPPALLLGGLAVAQRGTQEIDLPSIRARAAEQTGDAEDLAKVIRQRSRAVAEEAQATHVAAQANRNAYAAKLDARRAGSVLDFDAMIADYEVAGRDPRAAGPHFIAFASLSMPPAALRSLVRDMTRAGGVTVLRGFPAGDSTAFKKRLAAIWSARDATGSLGIDPRLFRAFAIEAAPSFIMLGSDFSPCDGFDCSSDIPPHDRIAGNISVTEVLETFASGRGPGAEFARLHLRQLSGEERP